VAAQCHQHTHSLPYDSPNPHQSASDLFRLVVLSDLALASDRVSDQRAAFLRRRWGVGAFRESDGGRGELGGWLCRGGLAWVWLLGWLVGWGASTVNGLFLHVV